MSNAGGKDITILKIRDTYLVYNPNLATSHLQVESVHDSKFPSPNGQCHYMGYVGHHSVAEQTKVVWNNNTQWTKKAGSKWLDPKQPPPKGLSQVKECAGVLEHIVPVLHKLCEDDRSPRDIESLLKLVSWLDELVSRCFIASDNSDTGSEKSLLVRERLPMLEQGLSQIRGWLRRPRETTSNSMSPQVSKRGLPPLPSNAGWCGKTVHSWILGGEQDDLIDSAAALKAERPRKKTEDEVSCIEQRLCTVEKELRDVGTRVVLAVNGGFALAGYHRFVYEQQKRLRNGRDGLEGLLEEVDGLTKLASEQKERKRAISKRVNLWIEECDALDKHLGSFPALFTLLDLRD